jgi:hypothetical protein
MAADPRKNLLGPGGAPHYGNRVAAMTMVRVLRGRAGETAVRRETGTCENSLGLAPAL